VIEPPDAGVGIKFTISNPNSEDCMAVMQRSVGFGPARERYKGPWVTSTLRVASAAVLGSCEIEFTGLVEGSIYFAPLRLIVDDGAKRISHLEIFRFQAAPSGEMDSRDPELRSRRVAARGLTSAGGSGGESPS
jgi:hypothetical protein